MKNLFLLFLISRSFNILAQDSLFLEFKSMYPKNPYRNIRVVENYPIPAGDTAKLAIVDYYFYYYGKNSSLSLIFFHKDSLKMKEITLEELNNIKVMKSKDLAERLKRISEKERREQKVIDEKRKKEIEKKPWIALPENHSLTLDGIKKREYLSKSHIFLIIKDEREKKAKILPVKYRVD